MRAWPPGPSGGAGCVILLDVVPPLGKRSSSGSASGAILRGRGGGIVEAVPTANSDADARLQAIEEAVSAGNTDLTALGFWRLVAQVKGDPALVSRLADRVGAVDTAAFRSAVGLRAPVWLGNLVLLAGAVVGAIGVAV